MTGYIAEVNINSSNSITLKKSASSPKNPFGQDFDELVFQSTEIGSGLFVSIAPKGVVSTNKPVYQCRSQDFSMGEEGYNP
uniref:Uncharacterized protein n=1 Tax=Acrobeloides nanus TaxID=290746 RepID=A0A914D8X3_9BILA